MTNHIQLELYLLSYFVTTIIAAKQIINNSKFLINVVRPFRQRLSCLKIDKLNQNLLAIGEHRIFPGWISTNYNVFAPIFLMVHLTFCPNENLRQFF
jgi:hypothetical protein